MKKGNVTILVSILAIALVAAGIGAGTLAYFFDTEQSAGNKFIAGTIDLTLEGPGTSPIVLDNMKPGDYAEGTIVVKNVGSLGGYLYTRGYYAEADRSGYINADVSLANELTITSFVVDGVPRPYTPVPLTAWLPPGPGAVQIDTIWWDYMFELPADSSKTLSITIQFNPGAGNTYQGQGIEITLVFLLHQNLYVP